MARKPLAAVLLLFLFSSCSSIQPIYEKTRDLVVSDEEKVAPSQSLGEETLVIVEEEEIPQSDTSLDIEEAEEQILKTYAQEELKKEDPVTTVAEGEADFELDYKKKHYDFWLKYFTTKGKNKERFTRHVKNGLKFKATIEKILEEEGLPKDLFYVGLIESGYNTHIRSRANAVGPWQFIKGTAKRYNLYVDSYLDERRNIFKATRAAANYFKDLYNIFGSWELALCAYNAGEYRIINAIRRGNTRDYKELVSKRLIPKETIFYIPKVAAARTLVESRYQNLKEPGVSKLFADAYEVEVEKPISLKKVARELKVPYQRLRKLNPDVKRDYVGRRRHYSLYVPKEISKVAVQRIEKMPRAKRSGRRIATTKKVHRVRRGESLYRIARKYNTTISHLKRNNNLKRNRIFIGQKLVVRAPATKDFYRVKRGDNLSKIASEFGLSTKKLMRMNGLRSSKIMVGQKLRVSGRRIYVVRRGDSLYRIARKFGVSVKRIVQANSLKGKTIFPKQKIILPI